MSSEIMGWVLMVIKSNPDPCELHGQDHCFSCMDIVHFENVMILLQTWSKLDMAFCMHIVSYKILHHNLENGST